MKPTRLLVAIVLLGAATAATAAPQSSAGVAARTADASSQPTVVVSINPVYPDAERKAGIEGSVVLACEIGADGAVTRLTPEQEVPGHPAFTEAAIAAVRQWRFKPAREAGKDVASSVKIPVKFKLDCEGKAKK